jgi:hypothetical protein
MRCIPYPPKNLCRHDLSLPKLPAESLSHELVVDATVLNLDRDVLNLLVISVTERNEVLDIVVVRQPIRNDVMNLKPFARSAYGAKRHETKSLTTDGTPTASSSRHLFGVTEP